MKKMLPLISASTHTYECTPTHMLTHPMSPDLPQAHTRMHAHPCLHTHTHVGIPIKTLVLNRHDSISNSFLAITVKRRKGPHLWATDGLQVKRGKPGKSHHNFPTRGTCLVQTCVDFVPRRNSSLPKG